MSNYLYKITLFITVMLLVWTACSDTTTGPEDEDLTGESITYDLEASGEETVEGTVTFYERYDGYTLVFIDLEGTSEEEEYLVNAYSNTIIEGGELLIELAEIGGSDGEAESVFTADVEGNPVSFEDLLTINAHINVYLNDEENGTVLAQADIGNNALTGESFSTNLEEMNGSGISGTAEFYERASGAALAVLELTGTDPEILHIAHLYEISDENGENDELLLALNDIDGETGIGMTNISELEDESDFGYEELEVLEGTIRIYFSEDDMSVVAEGNIHQENE